MTSEGLLGDHTMAQMLLADAYKYTTELRQRLYSWLWRSSKDKAEGMRDQQVLISAGERLL